MTEEVQRLLDEMMDSDAELYERILDTPGFAKAFNDLCNLARNAEAAVAAERERCAKIAERTARLSERRVGVEPLRAEYSRTIAESDRATAVELRDVALLIREGKP